MTDSQSQDTSTQDGGTPPADDEHAPTLDELARRQERTDGKLDELIALVKGGGSQPAGDHGEPDIARLVAEGVEKIEADKKAKADADEAATADKAWREKVDKRLEAAPKEPTGKVRGFVQRHGLGIRD